MWNITVGLFSILLIVVGLWFRWRKKRFSLFKDLGIPGPEPNILFGNLWEMAEKTPMVCHKEWIDKYGKVLGYYFGGVPTLLVADTELMKKVLVKDFHKFINRPNTVRANPNSKKAKKFISRLSMLRDKRWKEIRSIITPSFTTSKMRMMSVIMSNAVDSLIKIMDQKSRAGDSFDMYKLYQGLTMDVIGRTAFGVQTDCQNNPDDLLLRASKIMFANKLRSFFTVLALSFPELDDMWKYLNVMRLTIRNKGRNPITDLSNVVDEVIKTRRNETSSRKQDLLQIMIDAGIPEADINKITDEQLTADDGKNEDENIDKITTGSTKRLRHMVDREIADNTMLFFLAGYETTSTALAFTTHFLLHYPDVQEKIRAEIKDMIEQEGQINYNTVQKLQYLDQVIMESLRMYPPVYLFVNREAAEDIQYGSYKIQKGLFIQIPVYYVNHDPDLWPEPEKFDPNRFSPKNKANHNSMAFQTFGTGPRNCVGMRFALLEAKLALARILEKFTLLPTEDTDKDPISLRVDVALITPAKGINLRAVPC